MPKNNFKVLFIYPGLFMQTALPLSIASLTAALKSKGIEVKIFDTVLYQEPGEVDENEERAEHHHSTKKLDYASVGIVKKNSDLLDDFTKFVLEYKPDLIGLNAVESTFSRGIKLTRRAKEILNVPIIAGGVFPTLAPDVVIAERSIDIVCIGEGEDALVDLCFALMDKKDHGSIQNLWCKLNGTVKRNNLRKLTPLDEMVQPDFTHFQQGMFYKPMQGNLFKTIPIEVSRGCPYHCTYCAEPSLKRLHSGYHQTYFRKKSMTKLFSELQSIISIHAPEFFYFATETFLAMNEAEFSEFIEGYGKIRLPFWIQTRPETITREKILRLQEVGLFWLTIGIECGNEEYRRTYLKRSMSNKTIIEAIKVLHECGQGASLNSIIGFPCETRDLIFDTIMLNRALFKLNNKIRANISLFTPFRGCELYDLCVEKKFLKPAPFIDNTNISSSVLELDTISSQELDALYRTLPLYIYLPDQYLDRIKVAEQFTDAGNEEYRKLNRLVGEIVA